MFRAPQQFGLLEAPFATQPDARFLFASRAYTEALEQIASGIGQREALVVVTGEAGTGKTLLCSQVQERMGGSVCVSVVSDLQISGDSFMRKLLHDVGAPQFAVPVDGARSEDLASTVQQALAALKASGAAVVVIVDAAEQAQPAFLEQLGFLACTEADDTPAFQIVLVGRPSLDRLLSAPELRQLRQLVSRRHHLGPLTSPEVQRYLERRLWVAHGGPAAAAGNRSSQGFWRVRFSTAAVRATARLSAGIPAAINALSDRALEACFERRDTRIDASDVVSAARQMALPVPFGVKLESRKRLAAAALTLALAAGLMAWRMPTSPPNATGVLLSAAPGDKNLAPSEQPGSTETSIVPLVEIESFTVVAASFRSPSRAEALVARLIDAGLPAFTQAAPGDWHEVIVGPYSSREEAQAVQQQLTKAQVTNTRIVATAPNEDRGSRQEG